MGPSFSVAPVVRPLPGSLINIYRELNTDLAHPSPMSAGRGFFGSRPFSRANGLLARQGCTP